MQLRWYGSAGSGPLEMYKDYVRRGELEPGNSAQVCIADRFVHCPVFLGDESVI